ncbi:MAG: dTMP kinase [Alphaproteobacteria bacterium]|nr:dTMP kinase [Alphaproteobacteria bacterium]
MPGFFITFEGGEGSGKTTQINYLAETLTARGYKVLTTREPGGTPEGETLRSLIVQRGGGEWNPLSETLLLFASRLMLVDRLIKPALAEGKIVICDRFTDSTKVYQGNGRGVPQEKITVLEKLVLGSFEPDLTFVLDIDPETGLRRSGKRLALESMDLERTEDRFERLDMDFHISVRQGFLNIARQNPERCRVIDGSLDPRLMAENIEKITLEGLHGSVR